MCVMTHSYVCHDSCCDSAYTSTLVCGMTHSYVYPVHTCDMIYLFVEAAEVFFTWLIKACLYV